MLISVPVESVDFVRFFFEIWWSDFFRSRKRKTNTATQHGTEAVFQSFYCGGELGQVGEIPLLILIWFKFLIVDFNRVLIVLETQA